MRVLAHDPFAREVIEADEQAEWAELDHLLRESDFVSVHTLLSDDTRHLIGERELSLMKPSAYLINAARGPIVDERALVRALRTKRIAGAGLDVQQQLESRPFGTRDWTDPHEACRLSGAANRHSVQCCANLGGLVDRPFDRPANKGL